MPVDFHGYELLLLRRLQNDPVLCAEWLAKLQKKIVDDDYDLGVNILLFFMGGVLFLYQCHLSNQSSV